MMIDFEVKSTDFCWREEPTMELRFLVVPRAGPAAVAPELQQRWRLTEFVKQPLTGALIATGVVKDEWRPIPVTK